MKNDSQTFEKLTDLIKDHLQSISLDDAAKLASKIQYNFANSYPDNLEQENHRLREKVVAIEAKLSEHYWTIYPDRMGS